MYFRSDNLQIQLNDIVNEDCNMKSFMREIESKLCIIEKNQQAMLKLLQSSVDKEGNSKNLLNKKELVRINDSNVTRKKGSVGMYANINTSDEEEIRKLNYMDELSETRNICQITER